MYQGTRSLMAKKAIKKKMRDEVAVDHDKNPVLSKTSNEMLRQRKN